MQILLQATTIDGNKVKSDVLVDPNSLADKHYEHIQTSASTIWTVNHKLKKHPSYRIVDSNGDNTTAIVVDIDEDNLELHFTYATSGIAYFN